MKGIIYLILLFLFSCNSGNPDQEKIRLEIIKVEKDFESAVKNKGIAQAFTQFADVNAVIKRRNDTLIKGKENIERFYRQLNSNTNELNWSPDFIGLSKDGTLAYTYGRFIMKSRNGNGQITESKGVFHTIWKKQRDGTWKYVWD